MDTNKKQTERYISNSNLKTEWLLRTIKITKTDQKRNLNRQISGRNTDIVKDLYHHHHNHPSSANICGKPRWLQGPVNQIKMWISLDIHMEKKENNQFSSSVKVQYLYQTSQIKQVKQKNLQTNILNALGGIHSQSPNESRTKGQRRKKRGR